MPTPYRKKLIEVALPLEAINKESAREKSIRQGHPSTLHLWWARRPLAACRAVLFASLVDDPDSDPAYAHYKPEMREQVAGEKRAQLFNLIEELVKWENSNDELVINSARAEIARCVASRKIELGELKKDHKLPGGETVYDLVLKGHGDLGKLRDGKVKLPKAESVNAFLVEHAPPVLDPFCGGGSIPLEAQRLGLRAYGSDLNPVPVLITKALIEIPPKFANKPPVNPDARRQGKFHQSWNGAQGLAEDVRYYGKLMRDEAEKQIGHLYPKVKITAEMAKDRPDLKPCVGEDLTVIAWLWARTIQCPNPGCRARTPLVRSFWLSSKKGKACYAQPILDQKQRTCRFRVRSVGEPPKHTTDRTGARCLFCDTFVKKGQLRELAVASGIAEIPLAVVVNAAGKRVYLDSAAAMLPQVKGIDVPFLQQPITNDRRWFSPPLYGMPTFADLYTPRQRNALLVLGELVAELRNVIERDARSVGLSSKSDLPLAEGGTGPRAYADAVSVYLGIGVSRLSDASSSLVRWKPSMDQAIGTYGRQALPMVWDFAESNPFNHAAGDIETTLATVVKVLERLTPGPVGTVRQLDSTAPQELKCAPVVTTDPPYYDNIGYADLSDYFYVWLRHTVGRVYPQIFSTMLTPKTHELIASAHRHDGDRQKAQSFFESGLGRAFTRMREVHEETLPLSVFYAFKQTETDDDADDEEAQSATASTGWETMLSGLIRAGFVILGTWPMRTEMGNRTVGMGTNALASSIVLTCRPRPLDAPLATRREFLSALKRDLPHSLKQLQRGSVAPVDLAQAAIGPGMAVFTRYSKVMEADGTPMKVRQALALINQTLDEVLADQEGEFDADTRWALAWFEQHAMDDGVFGVAETLSKAKNTAINALVESGIVQATRGKVRLVKRDELPADWNPATDTRLRHWEIVQHLIRALETGGETAAADLLRRVGGMSEIARDLAYRLYNVCERKGWASEALAYNGLVIAWPEINKLAQAMPAPERKEEQARMF